MSVTRIQFPSELEQEYADEYCRKSLTHIRAILFLGCLVIGILSLINDVTMVPSLRDKLWAMRYGIFLPTLLGVLLLTYRKSYPRYMQASMAFSSLIIAGTSMAIYALMDPSEERGFFFAQMMVLSFCVYTLLKLRFKNASIVGWIILAAFNMTAFWLKKTPTQLMITYNFFLIITNVFGMMASYSMEKYLRKDFLLSRMLEEQRAKAEELLLNILPGPIADRLKQGHNPIADQFVEVTVLFADIVDFTRHSSGIAPRELVSSLNAIFTAFDHLAEKNGLEKVKTIGDAYMVVGGLPEPDADHVTDVADMALDMLAEIKNFDSPDGTPFEIRIGINSGPVVAGVIGKRKFIYDLWGDAVNVASRMESHGTPDRIQVTETTYNLLKHRYTFEPRGTIPIKGKGELKTWFLTGKLRNQNENARPAVEPAGR